MSDPEIIKSNSPHRVTIPEGSSNAVSKKAEVGEASIRKVLNDASGETNEVKTDNQQLKGKITSLSLDEEIAAAKAALLNKKMLKGAKEGVGIEDELRAEKAGVKTDDELRAEKEGVKVSDELRGQASLSLDGELRAAKAAVSADKDLQAEKEGISTNTQKIPKEAEKLVAELQVPKAQIVDKSSPLISPDESLPNTQARKETDKDKATAQPNSMSSNELPLPVNSDMPKEELQAEADEPEMDFPARVVHLKIENDNLRSTLNKLESAP